MHISEIQAGDVVLFFAGLGLTYLVFTRVPTGFVPDEDQGYFIIVIQAPSGASLEYTKAIGKQISDMLAKRVRSRRERFRSRASALRERRRTRDCLRSVEAVFAAQRRGTSATAIVNRVRPMLFGIPGGDRVCDLAARDQGLGQFGGFQFVVQDRAAHKLEELAGATQGLMREAANEKIWSAYTRRLPRTIRNIW